MRPAGPAAPEASTTAGEHSAPFYISSMSFGSQGETAYRAYAEAARIRDTTAHVFAIARDEHTTSARAADELARRRIAAVGGGPYRPGEASAMRDALIARRELFTH